MFHFGHLVGVGTVTVAASTALEAVAGESVSVAAQDVAVSGGTSVVVSGKTVQLASKELGVKANSIDAAAQNVAVSATSALEVFSGGHLSATGVSMSLQAVGDVEVAGCVAAVGSFVGVSAATVAVARFAHLVACVSASVCMCILRSCDE